MCPLFASRMQKDGKQTRHSRPVLGKADGRADMVVSTRLTHSRLRKRCGN